MENNKHKWTCGRCQSSIELNSILEEVKKCPLCGFSAESLKESDKVKKQILKG